MCRWNSAIVHLFSYTCAFSLFRLVKMCSVKKVCEYINKTMVEFLLCCLCQLTDLKKLIGYS